ncbi:MAG: exo-alpha-sialidase [Cyclobacteriaceae bacterium]
MRKILKQIISIACLILITSAPGFSQVTKPQLRKIKDIVIYEDSVFYSSFPSVVKNSNGEFLLAFRRAPDRKIFGEKKSNHTDPASQLVMVRSKDGENWTNEPELIYAHPFGGSQDPCLLLLRDNTLLCTSYGWAFVQPNGLENIRKPNFVTRGGAVFLGGYILRSTDGGNNWSDAIYPPNITPDVRYNALSQPLPAYNRGALYEGENSEIYWIVAAADEENKTSNHLLISKNTGISWQYQSEVASDPKASFNEASVYQTPMGDLVGFLRTAKMDDQACIARSSDGGKTFTWESMGFQGHPLNAMRLQDNNVLLTYGYRHEPYGIRARILNAECTDYKESKEFIIRKDGGNRDIGYSWPVILDDNRILVSYYFNKADGTRHIAGSILEIMSE